MEDSYEHISAEYINPWLNNGSESQSDSQSLQIEEIYIKSVQLQDIEKQGIVIDKNYR